MAVSSWTPAASRYFIVGSSGGRSIPSLTYLEDVTSIYRRVALSSSNLRLDKEGFM
jgi:hypothetical protein